MTVGEGGVCRFGFVQADGSFYILGPAFQARAGRWIGAKIGLYCVTTDDLELNGHADFTGFKLGNHL